MLKLSQLKFRNLETLWDVEIAVTKGDKNIYDNFCKEFGFVKGAKTRCTDMDLHALLDHIFIFKTNTGERYFIANSYLPQRSIEIWLSKLGLSGDAKILGPGFWCSGSTAILFNFEPMKEILKYGYLKSVGEEEFKQKVLETRKKVYEMR